MMQMELAFRPHGGKRKGAGRKRRLQSDPPHCARAPHVGWKPVHVTCRAAKGVGRLRVSAVRTAVGDAIVRLNRRQGFRVVHVSLQADHVHYLIESDDQKAFTSGMRALTITTARAINKAKGRAGKVWAYRYHATYVASPRQARHALSYVLNNWRHHREDEKSIESRFTAIDPYASSAHFTGWRERVEAPSHPPFVTASPETWLLNVGWKEHHPLISIHETPRD